MAEPTEGNGDTIKPRIPAWKRIGLQLRNASLPQDGSASGSTAISDNHPVGNVTISSQGLNDRPQKKRKLSPAPRPADFTSEARNGLDSSGGPLAPKEKKDEAGAITNNKTEVNGTHLKHDLEVGKTAAPRRKSVTFTEETKQEDGFSAKSLFKKSTTAGQPPPVAASTEQDDLPVTSPANDTPAPPPQQARKQKSAKKDKRPPQSSGAPPYLDYLDRFENDKRSWKFNKNRQTELLKHALDVQRIPTEYNKALLNYIAGLQGAAARARLIDDAFAVLKDISSRASDVDSEAIEGMESLEAKRNAYAAALKNYIQTADRANTGKDEYIEQQLEEIRKDAAKAQRSDEVLFTLLSQALHPEQHSSARSKSAATSQGVSEGSAKLNGTTASTINGSTTASSTKSKPNKRKSRTQTSSSDSSSSDDSSDNPDASRTTGPKTISEAVSGPYEFRKAGGDVGKADGFLKTGTGKRKVFDDDLLDSMFPRKQSAYQPAAKKRKEDTSKSESEESSSSESSSDSE